MNKLQPFIASLVLVLFTVQSFSSLAQSDTTAVNSINTFQFPSYVNWVNDFEGILSDAEETELNVLIGNYEEQTTNEIAVVTVNDFGTYSNIVDYSVDLSNEWGVGKKETDNGLTILLSKNMRQVRIATGFGTQKVLSDSLCKSIIDNTLVPSFKKDEYFLGLRSALGELMSNWK